MSQVLVVGNEVRQRHLLRRLVEDEGYECQEAEDGIEALWLLELGRVDETAFVRVVITELSLAGMNGLDFLKEISDAGHLQMTRVIVLAKSLSRIMQNVLLEVGVHSIFTQPYDLDRLQEVVMYLMERQRIRSH